MLVTDKIYIVKLFYLFTYALSSGGHVLEVGAQVFVCMNEWINQLMDV